MKKSESDNELNRLRDALVRPENRCFGRKIDLRHDLHDEHIDPEEMPLFGKILGDLAGIIERVEREIEAHEEESPFRATLMCEPRMDFEDPEYRDHPEQWEFVVHRSDWEDFEYCLKFHGSIFQEFSAGD